MVRQDLRIDASDRGCDRDGSPHSIGYLLALLSPPIPVRDDGDRSFEVPGRGPCLGVYQEGSGRAYRA